MADNVAYTPGSGSTIAADDISGVMHQRVKLSLGADGSAVDAVGTAARGLYTDPRALVVRLAVTPTVSTSPAYSAKDAIGGLMTFSNAVRASGGTGTLQSVQIADKDQELKAMDLVLFDRSITGPTDNAIFAPTDAETLNCIGVISFVAGDYADFSTNSVATKTNLGLKFVANGTDLYGVLVARATPQFTATTDIVVALTIAQD